MASWNEKDCPASGLTVSSRNELVRGYGIADGALAGIVLRSIAPKRSEGILVYGSVVRSGLRAKSDIDLIHVTEELCKLRRIQHIGEFDLDIYASGASLLERAIRTDKKNNHNFVLNAFANGRELIAGNGTVKLLREAAQRIWQRGPLCPSPAEQENLTGAIAKAAACARQLLHRSLRSQEWHEMAVLECGHLFRQLLYAYCRMHRLWASALWEMLEWQESSYFEINSLSRAYLYSKTLEEKVSVLEKIAHATLPRSRNDYVITIS